MDNTPLGCGSHLPKLLKKIHDTKSRCVDNCFQRLELDPNSIKELVYQPKLRPASAVIFIVGAVSVKKSNKYA